MYLQSYCGFFQKQTNNLPLLRICSEGCKTAKDGEQSAETENCINKKSGLAKLFLPIAIFPRTLIS